MKRLLNYFLITVVISALSLPVMAQRSNNGNWNRGQQFNKQGQFDRGWQGNRHQVMMDWLNLTEEQRSQINDMHVENQQEMLPLRNELREKRARLRTLQTSSNYDADEVNALLEEIGDLRTDMSIKRNEHRQEVRNQLTDEQRVQFDNRPYRSGKKGMRSNRNCTGFGRGNW